MADLTPELLVQLPWALVKMQLQATPACVEAIARHVNAAVPRLNSLQLLRACWSLSRMGHRGPSVTLLAEFGQLAAMRLSTVPADQRPAMTAALCELRDVVQSRAREGDCLCVTTM
jgi:hypothetical protein